METIKVTIAPEELFDIHNLKSSYGRKPSIDAYVAIRSYATHEQAMEVAQVGNILPVSYVQCLEYGDAMHDEIIHAATVDLPGPPRHGALFQGQSQFDVMVSEYIKSGQRVRLADGVIGYKLGITNQGAYSLNVMLKYADIEEIAAAWKQLIPRQSSMTFRKLVANGETPENALTLLYK